MMEVCLTCVSPKYQRMGIGIQLHEKVFVSYDCSRNAVWLVQRLKFLMDGKKLMQTFLQLVAVAAERGIPLITAHATSTYTQKIYANDGFDVVAEVIYKDYLVGRERARFSNNA